MVSLCIAAFFPANLASGQEHGLDELCHTGVSAEPQSITAEAERLSAEPLQPLHRFSADRLGEMTHRAVALVFEWFWSWYDAPLAKRQPLDLGGGVLVDGKPHDFTLQVRQDGEDQVYLLAIESFGRVTLRAHRPGEGRQELEFELRRAGELPRGGHIMLKPQ